MSEVADTHFHIQGDDNMHANIMHVCRGPSAVSALNMLRAGPIHVVVTR